MKISIDYCLSFISLFDANSNTSQTAVDKQWANTKWKRKPTPSTATTTTMTTTTTKKCKKMNKKDARTEWINKHNRSACVRRVFMFFDMCSLVFSRLLLSFLLYVFFFALLMGTFYFHSSRHMHTTTIQMHTLFLFLPPPFFIIRFSTRRNVKSLCTNTHTYRYECCPTEQSDQNI